MIDARVHSFGLTRTPRPIRGAAELSKGLRTRLFPSSLRAFLSGIRSPNNRRDRRALAGPGPATSAPYPRRTRRLPLATRAGWRASPSPAPGPTPILPAIPARRLPTGRPAAASNAGPMCRAMCRVPANGPGRLASLAEATVPLVRA